MSACACGAGNAVVRGLRVPSEISATWKGTRTAINHPCWGGCSSSVHFLNIC